MIKRLKELYKNIFGKKEPVDKHTYIINTNLNYKDGDISKGEFLMKVAEVMKEEMDIYNSEEEKIQCVVSMIIYYGFEKYVDDFILYFNLKYNYSSLNDLKELIIEREGKEYYESRL